MCTARPGHSLHAEDPNPNQSVHRAVNSSFLSRVWKLDTVKTATGVGLSYENFRTEAEGT